MPRALTSIYPNPNPNPNQKTGTKCWEDASLWEGSGRYQWEGRELPPWVRRRHTPRGGNPP